MKTQKRKSYPLAALVFVAVLATSLNPLARAAGFVTNTPLITSRFAHTATLLSNGKVLVAGGYSSSGIATTAELHDPATGAWVVTGAPLMPRREHTATLLQNGKVLMVGGYNSNNVFQTSAELYDPVTGQWSTAGNMSVRRYQHSATLLPNGKVLVAGGSSFGTYLSSTELYDPESGLWTNGGPMNGSRTLHTATLLPDGQVLVAAGFGTNQSVLTPAGLTNCEVYNPISGTWTNTGSMAAARWYHMATLLPNGKVLVASGFAGSGGGFRTSAELYDPATGTWANTGPLSIGRTEGTATLLPSGNVIVIGGYNNPNIVTNAEIYNPASGTWTATHQLNLRRYGHSATLLANGRILVAGGQSFGVGFATNHVELFDSDAGNWTSPVNTMARARQFHTATLLPSGSVLLAGGRDNSFNTITNAELFQPTNATWTTTSGLLTARRNHTATLLPNGMVLAAGGLDPNINYLFSTELYDSGAGIWKTNGALNVARANHTATLLANGKVLVAGGASNLGATNSAEVYNPGTGNWTTTGALNIRRERHTATLLADGRVLVAGGQDNGANLASVELYNPITSTWTVTNSLSVPRANHTATLLPNGKVLVAGGESITTTNSAELFDPATGAWTQTAPMITARANHTAMLLPNGKVLVANGHNSVSSYLSNVELYDPATGTWTATAGLSPASEYHTATLLANGRVLVAGGFNGSTLATSALYDIGLGFSNAWRAQITTITSPLSSGASLSLTGSKFRGVSEGGGGNTSYSSPSDHPVVQLRSVEGGRTVFSLATSWTANAITTAAGQGVPSGWALATVFVNGIPSTSSVVRVESPQIYLANPLKLAGGAFQYSFTNTPGLAFTALTSTNIALPLSNWTILGAVTEIAPGQYQFTDVQNTNDPMRFHSVRQP